MKLEIYSYRFAEEILQHPRHANAWQEIRDILASTPLFIYPNKSVSNPRLDIVQQLMNAYFDRVYAVDHRWEYHPLATRIEKSNLRADFRKAFGDIAVQAEIQFGNMARWYSDIFKFQAAYSQRLIQVGVSVVAMADIAKRIDSNVVQFERAKRELPSAELSVTLPIMMVGLTPDADTPIIDVSRSQFSSIGEITGRGKSENLWRVVNNVMLGVPIEDIGLKSPIGPRVEGPSIDVDEE